MVVAGRMTGKNADRPRLRLGGGVRDQNERPDVFAHLDKDHPPLAGEDFFHAGLAKRMPPKKEGPAIRWDDRANRVRLGAAP
jgi:hypothetical protein